MKTYEEIALEVVELEVTDIITTSDEEDTPPVDIGNGDTPAIPAMPAI